MKTAVKIEPMDVNTISFQEASLDIWDKKYRLTAKDGTPVDRNMDETYKRVARALADVEREEVREQWYEKFVGHCAKAAFPLAASCPTPGRKSTSQPPLPSIAPCPARFATRWTTS
jgi:ribonucleoside-diphosphate reductase alpha chain